MTAGPIVGPSRTPVLAQALGRHPRWPQKNHYYNLLRPQAEGDRAGLWARLEAVQHYGRFFDNKNSTRPIYRARSGRPTRSGRAAAAADASRRTQGPRSWSNRPP